MAKKKNNFKETTIENFYDLRVDKIDELVAALKDESYEPQGDISMNISDCTGIDDPRNVTRSGKQKQFDPYKTDFLGRIPTFVKAIFVKWWFAGVVCYFIMWGLHGLDALDQMVLLGAVLGLVVDVLVNPLFRYMETDRKEYNDYMMFPFPFKAFWTFFTNVLYYVLIVTCVMLIYAGITNLVIHTTGSASVWTGVEPLLFGVYTVAVDMIFIGIKDGIVRLVKKRRKKEIAENV